MTANERDVYESVRMRTITGTEAKQDEGADATDGKRLRIYTLPFSVIVLTFAP